MGRIEDTYGDYWTNVFSISVTHASSQTYMLASVHTGSNQNGISRSTDGGIHWAPAIADSAIEKSTFVSFDPADSMKAVGEVTEFPVGDADGRNRAVYSTDRGASWTTATRYNGATPDPTPIDFTTDTSGKIIKLAYHKDSPNIVYAQDPGAGSGAISKSTDGGHTFTRFGLGGIGELSEYMNTLWVSPDEPDFLVSGSRLQFRSTDGGVTFSLCGAGAILEEEDPHNDTHRVIEDPEYDG